MTWDEVKKKISVLIRPVETELTDVNVLGCHPPWYLWYVPYGTYLASPAVSISDPDPH